MAQTTAVSSSTTRHIDRILEVIDRALGIDDITEPGPVLFDPRPPEPDTPRRPRRLDDTAG